MRVMIDDGAFAPTRAHSTDAGLDLRTPVDVTVPPHGSCIIDTGVHIELPQRTVGMLKSKSGLNVKSNIISEGVIDEGYTGSIVVKLRNTGDSTVRFSRGDKVTQLVVMPVFYVPIELVPSLDMETDRGANGFGSTGR